MLALGKPVWREKTRLTSPGYSDFKSLARFTYSFLFFSLLKKTKRGYARRVKIELIKNYKPGEVALNITNAVGRSRPLATVMISLPVSLSTECIPEVSQSLQNNLKQKTLSSTNNYVPSHRFFFIPKGKLRKKKPQELSQKLWHRR